MQNKEKVAIVLNSPMLNLTVKEKVVICADGGVNHAVGKFIPTAIVGDFDSAIDSDYLCKKIVCPVDKDYTDGERAVKYAQENGYEEIVIYGIDGGRNDHAYANLSLLAFANSLGLKAKAVYQNGYVFYSEAKESDVEIKTEKGNLISVLPFGLSVTVTNSKGLYYPYNTLVLTRTRAGVGMSNIAISDTVSFKIISGSALIFVVRKQ